MARLILLLPLQRSSECISGPMVLLKSQPLKGINFRNCRLISRKIPPPGKPPICPPAKRILYHVVHHRWLKPDVVKELLWRRHVYNNAIVSLRKLFKEESARNKYDDMIAKEASEENEEFEHLLKINEERNRKAAEFVSVERSKHFVTDETLDEKLEEALDNPIVYDYAIDLQGNRYYVPIPEKYIKGTPPRQKGRMYDITLGTEHYSNLVPFSANSNTSAQKRILSKTNGKHRKLSI
ncbi:BMA-MRPS-26 [Dirofilaria immitis]|nr:BMA-MRPS-26 [Dirofilaria immitis]